MEDKVKKFLRLSDVLYNTCLKKEMIQRQCTNIGRMECELLNYLTKVGHPVCMNDLSKELKVSHSRITRIIDTLVKKKLVKRFPSKQDRRSWLAEITEKGKQDNERTVMDFISIQNRIIQKLPQDKIDEIYNNIELYLKIFNEVLNERDTKRK